MDTHYFTFGRSHQHPETGELLCDYWVEIVASSSQKARDKMFELFGRKWGFHYHERQFMRAYHLFKKGCYARYEVD
jgi:hypothetical protein